MKFLCYTQSGWRKDMKEKITISQISKLSGVSPATVSRVFNHRELVKEETIDKVEAALKKLGYIIPANNNTSNNKLDVIVVNVPTTMNYFYPELLQGIKASAVSRGYLLLIHEAVITADTIDSFCRLLKKVDASGVILLTKLNTNLLDQIHAFAPLVQCCEYNKDSNYPYVSIDDYSAATLAIEHLINSGRNKIAIINGPATFKYASERGQAYYDTMERHSISILKSWIVQLTDINYDMAYSSVYRMLNSDTPPNAIFCISDIFAMATIKAISHSKLKCPQDVMVASFDNIRISNMTVPSITSVNQPKFEMGYSACEILVEMISNPDLEPQSVLMATELIVRESTRNF